MKKEISNLTTVLEAEKKKQAVFEGSGDKKKFLDSILGDGKDGGSLAKAKANLALLQNNKPVTTTTAPPAPLASSMTSGLPAGRWQQIKAGLKQSAAGLFEVEVGMFAFTNSQTLVDDPKGYFDAAVLKKIGVGDLQSKTPGGNILKEGFSNFIHGLGYALHPKSQQVAQKLSDKKDAKNTADSADLSGVVKASQASGLAQNDVRKIQTDGTSIGVQAKKQMDAVLTRSDVAQQLAKARQMAADRRARLATIIPDRASFRAMANGGGISEDPNAVAKRIQAVYHSDQAELKDFYQFTKDAKGNVSISGYSLPLLKEQQDIQAGQEQALLNLVKSLPSYSKSLIAQSADPDAWIRGAFVGPSMTAKDGGVFSHVLSTYQDKQIADQLYAVALQENQQINQKSKFIELTDGSNSGSAAQMLLGGLESRVNFAEDKFEAGIGKVLEVGGGAYQLTRGVLIGKTQTWAAAGLDVSDWFSNKLFSVKPFEGWSKTLSDNGNNVSLASDVALSENSLWNFAMNNKLIPPAWSIWGSSSGNSQKSVFDDPSISDPKSGGGGLWTKVKNAVSDSYGADDHSWLYNKYPWLQNLRSDDLSQVPENVRPFVKQALDNALYGDPLITSADDILLKKLSIASAPDAPSIRNLDGSLNLNFQKYDPTIPTKTSSVDSSLAYLMPDRLSRSWIDDSSGSPITQTVKGLAVMLDKGAQTTFEMLPMLFATEGLGIVGAGSGEAAGAAAEGATSTASSLANVALAANKFGGIAMQWHFVNGMADNIQNIVTNPGNFGNVVYNVAEMGGTVIGMGTAGWTVKNSIYDWTNQKYGESVGYWSSLGREGVTLGTQAITSYAVGALTGDEITGRMVGYGLSAYGLNAYESKVREQVQLVGQAQSALRDLSNAKDAELDPVLMGRVQAIFDRFSTDDLERFKATGQADLGSFAGRFGSWLAGAEYKNGTTLNVSQSDGGVDSRGRQALDAVLDSRAAKDSGGEPPSDGTGQTGVGTGDNLLPGGSVDSSGGSGVKAKETHDDSNVLSGLKEMLKGTVDRSAALAPDEGGSSTFMDALRRLTGRDSGSEKSLSDFHEQTQEMARRLESIDANKPENADAIKAANDNLRAAQKAERAAITAAFRDSPSNAMSELRKATDDTLARLSNTHLDTADPQSIADYKTAVDAYRKAVDTEQKAIKTMTNRSFQAVTGGVGRFQSSDVSSRLDALGDHSDLADALSARANADIANAAAETKAQTARDDAAKAGKLPEDVAKIVAKVPVGETELDRLTAKAAKALADITIKNQADNLWSGDARAGASSRTCGHRGRLQSSGQRTGR